MSITADHTASILREQWEKVADLNAVLGPTLVAVALHTTDRTAPTRWAKPDAGRMNDASFERLTTAHQALTTVLGGGDDRGVARAWFVAGNPMLEDDSPVNAIHDALYRGVLAAARAFARDAWS